MMRTWYSGAFRPRAWRLSIRFQGLDVAQCTQQPSCCGASPAMLVVVAVGSRCRVHWSGYIWSQLSTKPLRHRAEADFFACLSLGRLGASSQSQAGRAPSFRLPFSWLVRSRSVAPLLSPLLVHSAICSVLLSEPTLALVPTASRLIGVCFPAVCADIRFVACRAHLVCLSRRRNCSGLGVGRRAWRGRVRRETSCAATLLVEQAAT